jgi:hypothetical protein
MANLGMHTDGKIGMPFDVQPLGSRHNINFYHFTQKNLNK